ncbi:GNAT family N-acetyltransferase [Bartonella sp. DGB2]|uniref:GNAT family N-acetyltransferase n=1 Tax=Bartonella sp. DGB2 TaxID=3388426 RepID=UPI00398FEE38
MSRQIYEEFIEADGERLRNKFLKNTNERKALLLKGNATPYAGDSLKSTVDSGQHPASLIACPVLIGRRLLLRRLHIDDCIPMAELANDPRLQSTTSFPAPYRIQDAEIFLQKALAGKIGLCVYAVTLEQTGQFIGVCDLHPCRLNKTDYEVGYWIGAPFWGKGYASEAAELLVAMAFRVTPIVALYAFCLPYNFASKRVLEKVGFLPFDEAACAGDGDSTMEAFILNRERWLIHCGF